MPFESMSRQKKKLMAMLGTAVGGLTRLDTLVPAVRALGERHAGYGVTAAQFAPVGAALLWTLEQGLREDFTPEVRQAWATVYDVLSSTMSDAMRTMPKAA